MALSSEVELSASRARFRLGATSSYHLLITDRLRALREMRIPGFSTVAEFIERRLLPAMRTCEIAQRRLDSLGERINRTAGLLPLEQAVLLNLRNQAILSSLNRRSRLQLRLQNLVEGFSIFAIAYYVLSILEMLLRPLAPFTMVSNAEAYLPALLVPLVLFVTWRTLEGRQASRAGVPSAYRNSMFSLTPAHRSVWIATAHNP